DEAHECPGYATEAEALACLRRNWAKLRARCAQCGAPTTEEDQRIADEGDQTQVVCPDCRGDPEVLPMNVELRPARDPEAESEARAEGLPYDQQEVWLDGELIGAVWYDPDLASWTAWHEESDREEQGCP